MYRLKIVFTNSWLDLNWTIVSLSVQVHLSCKKMPENVRRRAVGVIFGHLVDNRSMGLLALDLSPVHARQFFQELSLMFKIITNEIDIDFSTYFSFRECNNNEVDSQSVS